MAQKKYLSLDRLEEYDSLIKSKIDSGDSTTLSSSKSYTDAEIAKIKSGTITVQKAESANHATTADSATNATNATNAEHAESADEANHAVSANTATTAGSATKATQDGNGNVIANTYETKTDAQTKFDEAKAYTDTVASGKADSSHTHDEYLTEQIQSDLSQTDSTQVDYVKGVIRQESLPEGYPYKDGITIEWDGNTNGLHSENGLYLISETIITNDEFQNSYITESPSGSTLSIAEYWSVIERQGIVSEDYLVFPQGMLVLIRKPNTVITEVNNSIFEKAGVYVSVSSTYFSKISTGFTVKMSKEFLPDCAVQSTGNNTKIFNVLFDRSNNSIDKTFNEIKIANNNGEVVIATDPSNYWGYYSLSKLSDKFALFTRMEAAPFSMVFSNSTDEEAVSGTSSSAAIAYESFAVKDDDSVEFYSGSFDFDDIDKKIDSITAESIGAIPASTVIPSIDGLATEVYVDEQIANHNHDAKYDAKGAAADALASAQTYADSAAATVKNDLLNGAGTAYDTLKELGDLIDDNADAIDALETIASGKADASHSHAIADVSGLQSALDGKAAASHGTHVTFDSTNKPKMDGTAAFGTSTKVARADHVHPTDTSRAAKTDFDTHVADTTKHITSTERTNWGTAYTHSQAAHAPSNAEKNVIVGIQKNGTDLTVNSSTRKVNITVPTTAADIGAAASSHTHAISDITNLQTTLTNASSAISANTSSINTHTDKITALENKVGDGFVEITSAEISALFA